MTHKFFRFLMPAALLTVTALAQTGNAVAAPAAATAAPAPTAAAPSVGKIGIINIQQAIAYTNEGQRDFGALQKKFEPKQSELNNLNQEIENLKKQLQNQGDKLNDDARATMVRNIETKQKTLQRQVEDAQGDFQGQQGEIANRIGNKLLDVLDKYAKQNGYTLILDISTPQTPVLWAGPSIDLTKEIVDAYNAQSNVPPPATTAAAPAVARPAAPSATRPAAPKPAPKPATPPKQ